MAMASTRSRPERRIPATGRGLEVPRGRRVETVNRTNRGSALSGKWWPMTGPDGLLAARLPSATRRAKPDTREARKDFRLPGWAPVAFQDPGNHL
jgi:hypothetical protein